MSRDKKQVWNSIILFAKTNNFTINPLLGMEYFAKNYIKYGECACAPERKHCPCPEAIQEVNEKGKCKCGLYFKGLDCWLRWDPSQPDKSIMQEENNGHNNSDN